MPLAASSGRRVAVGLTVAGLQVLISDVVVARSPQGSLWHHEVRNQLVASLA